MKPLDRPTEEMVKLLKETGSGDPAVATKAMRSLAAALEIPLRQGITVGNIVGDIFTPEFLQADATAEYQLDFYQLGNEGDHIAYTIPSEGAIPTRHIGGDVVTVHTYDIANSIDWLLKYSRQARWNIVARAMEVLEAGFVKKMNTDGFRTIIAAGVGRNQLIFDSNAAPGQFTKRLVSLMKTQMRRLAGGNSASLQRGRLTDLYLSPEAIEDIRDWDDATDGVDDFTRREIFAANDGQGPLGRIYGVNLHDIDELGENQEFQNFFTSLGGSMGVSDTEIVVGLDLQRRDSFVMPVKEEMTVTDDTQNLHRRRRTGFYAWMELGWACLDPRRVLLGSF